MSTKIPARTPPVSAYLLLSLALVSLAWGFALHAYMSQSDMTNQSQLAARHSQDKIDKKLIDRLTARRLARETQERQLAAETITRAIIDQVDRGVYDIRIASTVITVPCNHSKSLNDPSKINVLTNKDHCIRPLDFAPSDLVSGAGVTMRAPAYQAYLEMQQAASAAGAYYQPTSSYRSFALQSVSYANWYRQTNSTVEAAKYSALPGYSEHQLGLAVDLRTGGCALECFATSVTYQWLRQHAHEFGFIERYPAGQSATTGYSPEPWHWRYVGLEIALAMKQQQLANYEQYVETVKSDAR